MTYLTEIPAIQDMAFCLGKEGCLFFVLCELAERITHTPIDVLRSARELIELNLLDYVDTNPTQHLKEAFYVKDRDAVLSYLTKIKGITINKVHRISKKDKRLYYIKYVTTTEPFKSHFTLPDYDTVYRSQTVANGTIDSYYVVTLP